MCEGKGKLIAALIAAQREFKPIVKNKTASIPTKAGGKYSYKFADIADVIAATQPALNKNGLAMLQGGKMIDGHPMLVTKLAHISGECDESVFPLTIDHDPKIFGALLTYYRRYEWTLMLGVASDEDGDCAETHVPVKAAPVVAPVKAAAPAAKPVTATKPAPVETPEWPMPGLEDDGFPTEEQKATVKTDMPVKPGDLADEGVTCKVGMIKACAAPKQVGKSIKYAFKLDDIWIETFSKSLAEMITPMKGQNVNAYFRTKVSGNYTNNVIAWVEVAE